MAKLPTDSQWQDLADRVKAKSTPASVPSDYLSTIGTTIPSNSNLNNYTTPGLYVCASATVASTLSNAPSVGSAFLLEVRYTNANTRYRQTIYSNNATADEFFRVYGASGWVGWRKVTTTSA